MTPPFFINVACDRRAFLKRAAATAVGAGLPGWSAPGNAATGGANVLRVQVKARRNPLVERTFTILQRRIMERRLVDITRVDDHPHLILSVDPSLPSESFRIDEVRGAVRVSGGSPNGLLYGVGKLLRTSTYTPEFQLSRWRGTSTPRGSLRGVYFATHFHNWYVQANEDEISRYLEDLALWGVNALKVAFPMINLRDWDDPETGPALEMMRKYARAANALGIQFAFGITNAMFIGAPNDIRAQRLADPLGRRGNSGHPICPSTPAGHAYLVENTRQLFTRLKDVRVDILVFWPYDEGGCSCDRCTPWGSNGYLKLSRDLARLARSFHPKIKTVLSTWMFDTPPEGEWQGLTDALAKGEPWLDYILADAHEDFPRYPLDVGVPGKRPLINFPEISMWGNAPWGGFGANPLPNRFQRLWDQVKQTVSGGFPYSEGIYEDINKAVVAQFYWNADTTARQTLEEYVAYEFGLGKADDAIELVNLLEQAASDSYKKQPVSREGVLRARQLADGIHDCLPDWGRRNWRWEIVRLRAVLDQARFVDGALDSPPAQAALLRLIEIYHCQIETDDPYHHRVRPPVRRAVNRAGRK